MKTTASRASAVSQTRGFGDLLYDKAGARPSLDLDFAGTGSLRDKISGENLVDHTRASKGTYIDNDGLIKEAAINYVTNHKGINNTTGYDSILNPEGNLESIPYISGAPLNHRFSGASLGGTVGQMYTGSVYLRTDQGTSPVELDVSDQNNTIVTVTDQWQRFVVVQTNQSVAGYRFFDILTSDGNSYAHIGQTFGNNGSSKIYVWGAQLEEGSEATDLIKTTGTTKSAPRFTHERVETGNLVKDTNRFLTDWSISATSYVEPYTALAPDGKYSAHKFVNNTGNYGQLNENAGVLQAGKTYTLSAYIKTTGNSSHFNLWAYAASSSYLATTGKTATPTDWTRYEVSFTAPSDNVIIGWDNTGGNWNSEFLFYGLQLEEADSASTYVPSIDTFTSRQSNATYVDSAGLVKTSAVNKIHGSHFATGWARDGGLSLSTHRNDVVNPFGETEFQRVLELSHSNMSAQSVWYQTGVGKGTGVLSVYAKAYTWSNLNFGGQTPSQTVSFNLTNGTINSSQGTTGAIESVGNGWYRCSVNINYTTDWLIFQPHQDGATRNGSRMQIVGAGSIFLYGAMFESPASQPSDFVENLTSSTASSPRYSHDPETLTPTGLYLEPAATNVWTHSEDVNSWSTHGPTASSVVVNSNSALAPNGTQTADKVTFGSFTNDWSIKWQGPFTGTYTWSGWIKTADNTTKDIYLSWGQPRSSAVHTFTATGEWQRFSAVVTPGSENVHIGNHNTESPSSWKQYAYSTR